MKIVSINLHCHKEENEDLKLGLLAKYILKEDIDVVLLQEVCQDLNNPYIINNLKEDNNGYILSRLTGYFYEFRGFKVGFGIYEEGLGILSKKKISDLELINLTHTESFNDWKRRCMLKFNYDNYNFIDVHLGWSLEDEPVENQLDKLLSYTNEKTILCGDFNYPDNTVEIKKIKSKLISSHDYFKLDSKLNPTFHNELDSKFKSDNKMIDFIFFGEKIKPISFEIDFKETKNYISDHSLLKLEIEG